MNTKPLNFGVGDKVLILTTNHLGNNIMCTPAIRFLKKYFPLIHISTFSLSKVADSVFFGNDDISSRYVSKFRFKFNKIAAQHSVVICLNPKSRFITQKCRTPVYTLSRFSGKKHHADETLEFMSLLIGKATTGEDRKYILSQDIYQSVLSKDNCQKETRIGMHLGCGRVALQGWKFFYKAGRTHRKLWPIESYIKLAKLLTKNNPNVTLVLTGTKNESFLARQIEEIAPNTINMIGKTTVTQLYQLMSEIKIFITHDCGVLHVASASSVPIVSLYGPTNYKVTGVYPDHPEDSIIQKKIMPDITVEEVFMRVKSLLHPHELIFN